MRDVRRRRAGANVRTCRGTWGGAGAEGGTCQCERADVRCERADVPVRTWDVPVRTCGRAPPKRASAKADAKINARSLTCHTIRFKQSSQRRLSSADIASFAKSAAAGWRPSILRRTSKHNRHVAIKLMKQALVAAIGQDRFLREIEIAARLNHPHVVPLFDSGAAGEHLFHAMPYIEGESLRARLARDGQLPLDEALRLAREVASALSHAHQHGPSTAT